MKQKRLLFLLALLMTAATGAWAQTGMTKGSFSVSATKRVHFSKGNLQLVGENTFQFAENQWDVFGSSQSNGHRDLFGWGSANNPNLTTENNNDYSTFTDWGTKIGDGTTWRTLTNDEWYYVLNTRTASMLNGTENARYAHATVNGVGGLILFPDNYTHPGTVDAPKQINTSSAAFNANTYDVNAWAAMEDAGAVFLPHGGCRTGSSYQSNQPNYWSSTPISETMAHGLNLTGQYGMEFKSWFRFRACAVRLVTDGYVLTLADGTQDAKNWTIASGDKSVKGDNADGLTGLNEDDAVTLTYGGHLKVKNVTATTDAAPAVVDLSKLTENTELKNGDVVTGTLNGAQKITIADGATVTLAGVTINGVHSDVYQYAGITCLGDATIILKDGTTNTVTGFDGAFPGIKGAAGKTLTITGTGSLYASCDANGSGAGIGSASYSNYTPERACGNIVIEGGTITAVGGYSGAGIGSGSNASCGNITIKSTVAHVTATKGSGAPDSIGAGQNGSCGTKTIEDASKVTQN